VAIGARRGDKLRDLAKQIEAGGGTALALDLDVTDEQACADAVARTRSELGGLDILVNCAGMMLLGPIVGADTDDWRRTMQNNVLGSFYIIHAAVNGLLSQGSGDIVNISSVAGRTAKIGSGIYNASKWAVNAFSESLRQEVTAQGVRVVLIEPGAVMTELNDHITDEDSKKKSQESCESMRSLQAEDVARTITFVVTQPDYVAINEILARPTDQTTP